MRLSRRWTTLAGPAALALLAAGPAVTWCVDALVAFIEELR